MQAHKHAVHHRPPRGNSGRDTLPKASIVDVDPEDPAQALDEAGAFGIEDLGIEALPASEARTDLDAATLVAEGEKGIDDVEEEAEEIAAATKDTGDLYGVHTQAAGDTELSAPEHQDSFKESALGENWIEALEAKSAENGPLPEQTIDVIDDSDRERGTNKSNRRDRPIADKGAGGRGGL